MLRHFSCVWLFVTPMDCSLPGSSIPEILQTWILKWVAMCSGDLSDSGVKPTSLTFPELAGGFFTTAAAAAAAAKSLQSCLTLCDPIDGSPPGSPVPGFSRQQHWSGLSFPSPLEPPKGSLAKDNSVQFSCSVMSDSLRPHGLQHARPPCPSPTPGAYSNSYPWSQWCYPTMSSLVVPFSSHPQSFPASGSFPVSQLFVSGGQR